MGGLFEYRENLGSPILMVNECVGSRDRRNGLASTLSSCAARSGLASRLSLAAFYPRARDLTFVMPHFLPHLYRNSI